MISLFELFQVVEAAEMEAVVVVDMAGRYHSLGVVSLTLLQGLSLLLQFIGYNKGSYQGLKECRI